MCQHLLASTPFSQWVLDVFRFQRSLLHLLILQACFTYRCVAILPAPLDGIVERQKGVKMKATMLIERDRGAIRCEYMQVDCFHHLHNAHSVWDCFSILQSYLKSFRGEVRYKVLKEKAGDTLLTKFFTHPKTQDVCHLQEQRCQISADSRMLER